MKGLNNISLLLSLLAGLWLAGHASATSADAGAPEMKLQYEIYVGGFHVLDSQMGLRVEREAYSSSVSAQGRGLLAFFTDFYLKVSTTGVSDPNGPRPQRFDSFSDSGDKSRRVVVRYGDDGEVGVEVDPPSEKDRKYPIPQHMRSETLDPLSTVLALGWTQLGQDGCQEDLEVFDGRRRFDLVVENLGWRSLQRSDYLSFDGEALACSLKLRMLSYGPQRESNSSYPDEAVIYLARLADGWPLVPVRLEMDLKIGSVRGHLANYDLPLEVGEKAQAER